jgi:hypothetical protein
LFQLFPRIGSSETSWRYEAGSKSGQVKAALRFARRQDMNAHTAATDTSVSTQLRPLVLLVAVVSVMVTTLLITTAVLGASPINSMEVASAI